MATAAINAWSLSCNCCGGNVCENCVDEITRIKLGFAVPCGLFDPDEAVVHDMDRWSSHSSVAGSISVGILPVVSDTNYCTDIYYTTGTCDTAGGFEVASQVDFTATHMFVSLRVKYASGGGATLFRQGVPIPTKPGGDPDCLALDGTVVNCSDNDPFSPTIIPVTVNIWG